MTQATTVFRAGSGATRVPTQETLDCLQEVFDEGMRYISGFQSPMTAFPDPLVFNNRQTFHG